MCLELSTAIWTRGSTHDTISKSNFKMTPRKQGTNSPEEASCLRCTEYTVLVGSSVQVYLWPLDTFVGEGEKRRDEEREPRLRVVDLATLPREPTILCLWREGASHTLSIQQIFFTSKLLHWKPFIYKDTTDIRIPL